MQRSLDRRAGTRGIRPTSLLRVALAAIVAVAVGCG